MIIHKGKPQAFGTKPVPELLHTIYITSEICYKPHWPAWCHTLRINCKDTGPTDHRPDHTNVHAGKEKSLISARNQTGDIAIARICSLGPLLLSIVR